MKKRIFQIIGVILLIITMGSCRDSDLDPTLSESKDINTSLNTADDLNAVVVGGYNRMSVSSYYGRDYIVFNEVRSDNTFANGRSNRFITPAQFSMNADDAYASDTWTQIYRVIANANIVINKDKSTVSGSTTTINNIYGQAYTMRALAHFDLLKLFGQYNVNSGGMSALGIPYVTEFKSKTNLYPSRGTVQQNYDMIMSDLDKAISLMSTTAPKSNNFFTYYAAQALKARIALYFKKYDIAVDAASKVINSDQYKIVASTEFAQTFSGKNRNNVIFAIANSPVDNQGINGLAYIYRLNVTGGGYADVIGLKDLYSIFKNTDVRGASDMIAMFNGNVNEWYNKGKYPDVVNFQDDTPLIRYEEVILTYAEALLKTGNTTDALKYLNMIPQNRKADLYTAVNEDYILLERRRELCFEGFRFDDLMRTGRAIPLVDAARQRFTASIPYGSTKLAFPIPNSEIGPNSNVKQNAGYN